MRLILFSLLIFMMTACSKSSNDDTETETYEKPGKIPGMGITSGLPQGQEFLLPPGISLVGEIKGVFDPTGNECKSDGNGDQVKVNLTLRNDSIPNPVSVTFPEGLVLTTLLDGYQHGLLIQKVVITIPAAPPGGGGSTCNVTLMLSCLNGNKEGSDGDSKYTFGPVTSSPLLKDFINRLKNKKILYSEYADKDAWKEVILDVQDALWLITDGDGLSAEGIEMINSIPNK